MTRSEFLAFYPQFASFTPSLVLDSFLGLANSRFSDFDDDAELARGLYTAHYLTLYARALPPEDGEGMEAIAAAGESHQRVASKKVGEVAVSYAASSSVSIRETPFADLPETLFGRQLLTLLRLHSFRKYIP